MSEIWWGLSGIDKRCEKYGPGHWVHWIHHKKSVHDPGIEIPVWVTADGDGHVLVEGQDLLLRRWNHRPGLVREALQRSGGAGIWLPRWNLLAVCTGDRIQGASNVFNLGSPADRTACINPPERPQRRRPPRPGSYQIGSGLTTADRYRAGRPGNGRSIPTTKGAGPSPTTKGDRHDS